MKARADASGHSRIEKNNFDGVRIGLALIVVLAHVSILTQAQEFKYFARIFDSNFAVKGFFAISGFLVTKSYLSSKGLLDYAEKRGRRIYPAYAAAIFLCFCVGAYATTMGLAEFLKSPQTARYLISNLAFLNFLQPTLPAALENNPIQALNGSLWTIKVEVMLYFCIPPMLYLFAKLGSARVAIVLMGLSVAWTWFFEFSYGGSKGQEMARQFPGQLSYFVFGALLAVHPKLFSKLNYLAWASMAAIFLIDQPQAKLLINPVAYASIVIWLSSAAFRSMNFGKFGDLSYGIYLYHFPLIQMMVFLKVFEANAWLGLILSLTLTGMASFFSWHGIEKKFLKRSSHYRLAAQTLNRL